MTIFDNERIIILDIETTGLDKILDRIIELGIIEILRGKEILAYSTLFGGGKSPKKLIRDVHGITDKMRKGKPTFEERAQKVASYLSNAVLVGHNLKDFDLKMIEAKLNAEGINLENIKVIDTLKLAKKADLPVENYKLGTLCEYFSIEYGNHRGLGDSRSTWELLKKLVEVLNIRNLNDIIM